jgi:uncharacterized protein YaaN involved in tellurite resistance
MSELAVTTSVPNMIVVQNPKIINEIMKEISDTGNSLNVVNFGVSAQAKATHVAAQMLVNVKNKDAGAAGGVVNDLMGNIRGLGIDSLDPNDRIGWFGKLIGRISPVVKFIQQYENIEGQIDSAKLKIKEQIDIIHRSVIDLDNLYSETESFYHDLGYYIEAGQSRLKQLNDIEIPSLQKKAEESNDALDAQNVQALKSFYDDLSRRVHDLILTRQDVIETLTMITMIMDTDKGLITKLNSAQTLSIPAWQRQIALAIQIYKQQDAANLSKSIDDTTNSIKERTAQALKKSAIDTTKQINRGVFDIEVLKKANAEIISTLQDIAKINNDARKQRSTDQLEIERLENNLKKALIDTSNVDVV